MVRLKAALLVLSVLRQDRPAILIPFYTLVQKNFCRYLLAQVAIPLSLNQAKITNPVGN